VRRIDARRALVHLVDVSARHAIERMRTDFVANASHELRTPLSSVLGFVETLLDPDVGGDQMTRERFLRVIEGESKRMERLVTDLMSLSRIEADRHRAPDAAVDLGALVAEQCRVIAAAGNPRAADLDCPAPQPDLPPVSGDKAQLSQILHNLVGNAMSYGRPGTPIEVRLGSRGNQVVLSVRDHGEGIAADHLPRLTERFYRVDPGRSRAAGGTGLGLAIVKHIVERHRGRLSIESAPGVGTTVTVLLPKHVMKA
jgi:two-component system, OmpR family, phosphate regulon sensor histidine kinase PhoR